MSEHNITLDGGSSVRLKTAGKYCDRDIIVTATNELVDKINGGTITEITSNLTTLREYAFAKCKQLTKVSLPFATSLPSHICNDCTKLKTVEMPNVTRLAWLCFYNCTNLELTELPSGLTEIGGQSFYNCKGLKTLTFKSNVTSIGSDVFSGCTNLLTINVPWAEGAVANAPWGATNATINYNYVG